VNRFDARRSRSALKSGLLAILMAACAHPATPAAASFGNLDSLVRAAKGDDKVWSHVAAAVIRGDSAVAIHASELLAHAGPAGLPAVRRLLRQPDFRSQRLGAYALGSLGATGEPAVADLIPLVGGADSSVANMADWSATRIAPQNPPRLLTLAHDLRYGGEETRLEAVLALKRIDADLEPVCPLLVLRLADPNPAVRRAAFTALDRAGASVGPCLQHPRNQTVPFIRAATRLLRIRMNGGWLGN
jgi:HEAT repeat protein